MQFIDSLVNMRQLMPTRLQSKIDFRFRELKCLRKYCYITNVMLFVPFCIGLSSSWTTICYEL